MYPRWIVLLLSYYDFWGFRSEFNTSGFYNKIVRIISVLHLFLVTTATLFFIQYFLNFDADTLGIANDIIKYFGALCVYWTIFIETNSKFVSMKRFWHIFQLIDYQHFNHQYFKRRFFLFKTISFFLAAFILHILYLERAILFAGTKYISFWFFNGILMMIYQHRAFYYLFYLDLVEYELNIIKNDIMDIVKTIEKIKIEMHIFDKRKSISKLFEQKRLKWIRNYYMLVYDMSECLNAVFGWSNMTTVLYSFLLILTDLNSFYWRWYNKNKVYMIRELSIMYI